MKGIVYSVTKLSLLLMVVGLLIFTYKGIIKGSEYVSIINIVIAFYYGNKIGVQGMDLSTNTQPGDKLIT